MIKTDSNQEVPCEIDDHDDGQYFVKYQVDQECSVNIHILFKDDKEKMVPLRGSPYQASFSAATKAEANLLSGTTLPKYVTKSIEQQQLWMKESSNSANTKDKDLTEIK